MSLAAHHVQLRDAVRRYAAEMLAPNAPAWDRDKHFPREEVKGLAQMGLMGVAIPEEWDGAGMDTTALAIACEEISAGDGATCTIVMVTNLVANILHGYGSAAQKAEFLKPVARGDMLGAFALTEPHVGSDAAAITTRAEKSGAGYVLNGVKQFVTSGKNADVAVVFAVTDKAAGKKGISAFVVPTSTPGYNASRLEEKTGQRASDTAQVVLENCKVSAAWRLAEEGVGYRIALANLETGRINVAAQATGMARTALEAALACGRPRLHRTLLQLRELRAVDSAVPRARGRPESDRGLDLRRLGRAAERALRGEGGRRAAPPGGVASGRRARAPLPDRRRADRDDARAGPARLVLARALRGYSQPITS